MQKNLLKILYLTSVGGIVFIIITINTTKVFGVAMC